MLKQAIAIILFSIMIILTMPHAQVALQWILSAHDWIAQNLTEIFSGGEAGNIIRNVLALLVIPVVIGLVPAIAYWLAKRSWFPYFMEIVWIICLIQTAALVIQYKAVS